MGKENREGEGKEELLLIDFEYGFLPFGIKARFHHDIDMDSGACLDARMPVYIVSSIKKDGRVAASYAGGPIPPETLGYKAANRKNYIELIEAECESLHELFGVPVIIERAE